jgi:hypothetical protein
MGQSNSTNNSVNYNISNMNITETVVVGLLCEKNLYRLRNTSLEEEKNRLDPIKQFIVDFLIKKDNINIIWETIDRVNANIIINNRTQQTVPTELHNKYDLIVGLTCPLMAFDWKKTFKFVYTTLKPNGILSFITPNNKGTETRYKTILSELRSWNSIDYFMFKDSFTNPKFFKHSIINPNLFKYSMDTNKENLIVVLKKKNIVGGTLSSARQGKKKESYKKKNSKKVVK